MNSALFYEDCLIGGRPLTIIVPVVDSLCILATNRNLLVTTINFPLCLPKIDIILYNNLQTFTITFQRTYYFSISRFYLLIITNNYKPYKIESVTLITNVLYKNYTGVVQLKLLLAPF